MKESTRRILAGIVAEAASSIPPMALAYSAYKDLAKLTPKERELLSRADKAARKALGGTVVEIGTLAGEMASVYPELMAMRKTYQGEKWTAEYLAELILKAPSTARRIALYKRIVKAIDRSNLSPQRKEKLKRILKKMVMSQLAGLASTPARAGLVELFGARAR